MSGLFDSQLVVTVGTEPTVIYQPETDGVAMSCLFTNGHLATLPVSVWIERGADRISLAVDRRIKSGFALDVLAGSKVALKAGDKVMAQAPIANVFTGVLSAYKDK